MKAPPATCTRCLLILASVFASARLEAVVILNAYEIEDRVEVVGSGSLNLDSLRSWDVNATSSGAVNPTIHIGTGPAWGIPDGGERVTCYLIDTLEGPSAYGSGGLTVGDSGTGDLFGLGFGASIHNVCVPLDYVSGTPLAGTTTYLDASFASLGIDRGTYKWTWERNGVADTWILNIGSAAATVPESNSTALLSLILFSVFGALMFRFPGQARHELDTHGHTVATIASDRQHYSA